MMLLMIIVAARNLYLRERTASSPPFSLANMNVFEGVPNVAKAGTVPREFLSDKRRIS
jgi:hypothetical protein